VPKVRGLLPSVPVGHLMHVQHIPVHFAHTFGSTETNSFESSNNLY